MKKAVFEFQFLTPAILAGAYQHTAEMRIPSLRGALRWWTRFIAGKEIEKSIFGCAKGNTGTASKVILRLMKSVNQRVVANQNAFAISQDKFDYFLWPFRENRRGIIQPGAKYTVVLQVKPDYENDEDIEWVEWIIKAFLLFGSMGTRSRRAYGSVWPVSAEFDGENWDIPQSLDDLSEVAGSIFYESNITIYSLGKSCKDYKQAITKCADFLKTIRCGKSARGNTASKWGQSDHDAGLQQGSKIYRAALGLPLQQKYSNGRTVIYSVENFDRLASPLHFKVIKTREGYLPIMLVIPEYVPVDGTVVNASVKNRGNFKLTLDHELLSVLQDSAEEEFNNVNIVHPVQ